MRLMESDYKYTAVDMVLVNQETRAFLKVLVSNSRKEPGAETM